MNQGLTGQRNISPSNIGNRNISPRNVSPRNIHSSRSPQQRNISSPQVEKKSALINLLPFSTTSIDNVKNILINILILIFLKVFHSNKEQNGNVIYS
jgi:hypothetical protein